MQNKCAPLILTLFIGVIGGIIGGGIIGYITVQTAATGTTEQITITDSSGETRTVVEDSSTTQVVEQVQSSVVSIVITKELRTNRNARNAHPFFDDFFFSDPFEETPPVEGGETEEVEVGEGSGFVVSEDGLILTNRHVVSDSDASYTVVFEDDSTYEATVLAQDQFTDLAIISIEATGLAPLELGDSDSLKQGQTVIAIGNTLGEYSNTVTKGVISGLLRDLGGNYTDLIQTDAAINEGNSGGPLLNLAGQVIGINTAVDRSGEGIGFAIPINETKIAIDSVKEHGRIIRPALGIRYIQVTEEIAELNSLPYEYGAYIRGGSNKEFGVIPGGAADKAGIEEGDIILEVNQTKIDGDNSLSSLIKGYEIGDTVTLKVYHDGEEKDVDVTLAEMPTSPNES